MARHVLAITLLLAGCRVDVDYGGAAFACADGACPSGFRCVEAKCIKPAGDAAAAGDAAMSLADASPDAEAAAGDGGTDSSAVSVALLACP